MEIEDIFNVPEKLVIDGKEYDFEFDNKSFATLETLTQKGTFKIRELLLDNNLTLNESIELVCCGLIKHYKANEISVVRDILQKTPSVWASNNDAILKAFLKPLMPPEVYLKMEEVKEKLRKLTEQPEEKKKKPKKLKK